VIETNQTREQLKDPEWAGYMPGKTLLGRLGRPEEVANVALFPASDNSSYVTGVDIVVDGRSEGVVIGGRARLDHSLSTWSSSARENKEFLRSPFFKGDPHGIESKDNRQY
jgi:hypothetical protein